jgi:hypothetical protein
MKFKDYLFGGIDPALFGASLIFAALGILFVLLLGTGLRAPLSPNSPQKFSWKYLWNDNLKRILASALAVLITLRFMTEITTWELTPWKAFVVGTGWDGIALFLKQKTKWLDPKPNQS